MDAIRVPLVSPEILEPVWTQVRVADGVRYVAVPQIMLNRPRVLAVVDELVTSRVAEHVRMNREAQARRLSGPRHELAYVESVSGP